MFKDIGGGAFLGNHAVGHIDHMVGNIPGKGHFVGDDDHRQAVLGQLPHDGLRDIAEFLNKVYGEGRVTVEIEDTYRNIGEAIKPCFEIVEAIDAAMKAEGVAPFYTPMRGGTDGTILSFEGIPCPNICTGGHNFHGRYEYVPVQSMEKIANILIGIVKSFAK